MAGENKSDEFLKINPQGTIPVLVDDEFVMNESRAICCYLVNAKSPDSSLYPTDDIKARYIIDQRLYYDASSFFGALMGALVSRMYIDFMVRTDGTRKLIMWKIYEGVR